MTGNRWFLTLGELSDASIAGLIHSGFELLDCSYSLYQGLDERGRTQTNVRVDGLHLVYDGLLSSEIIDWGLNPRKYYAGALVLNDANNMPQEKLFFEDGACVNFQISYIADGGSYATTRITVSPRVLKLGDDTLTQPWTLSDVSTYLKKISRGITKIAQPIGKTDLFLVIEDRDYEISEFDLSLGQSTDHKGQPTEEVKGGKVAFTVPQMADEVLRKWMLSSDKLMSGEFQFRRGDQSMPLRVKFDNAYCTSMNPHKHQQGDVRTSFVISANELMLNEKALFNNWRL